MSESSQGPPSSGRDDDQVATLGSKRLSDLGPEVLSSTDFVRQHLILLVMKETREESVYPLLTHLNSKLPSGQLHDYVLFEIFNYVVQDVFSDHQHRTTSAHPHPHCLHAYSWIAIAGVCTRWRTFVLSTPALWRCITWTSNTQWMDLVLSRSKSVSLSFFVDFSTNEWRSLDRRNKAWNTVLRQISRVKALRFRTGTETSMTKGRRPKNTVKAPLLTTIHLQDLSFTGADLFFASMQKSELPALKEVSTTDCLPAVSGIFARPTVIRFEMTNRKLFESSCYSARFALDILSKMPRLEEFSMINYQRSTPSPDSQIPLVGSAIVALPHLFSLRLCVRGRDPYMWELLDYMSFPATTLIDINMDTVERVSANSNLRSSPSSSATNCARRITRRLDQLGVLSQRIKRMQISLRKTIEFCGIQDDACNPVLRIAFDDDGPLCEKLRLEDIQVLDVFVCTQPESPPSSRYEVFQLGSRFINTRKITYESKNATVLLALLGASSLSSLSLAYHNETKAAVFKRPFPKLNELRMKCTVDGVTKQQGIEWYTKLQEVFCVRRNVGLPEIYRVSFSPSHVYMSEEETRTLVERGRRYRNFARETQHRLRAVRLAGLACRQS